MFALSLTELSSVSPLLVGNKVLTFVRKVELENRSLQGTFRAIYVLIGPCGSFSPILRLKDSEDAMELQVVGSSLSSLFRFPAKLSSCPIIHVHPT